MTADAPWRPYEITAGRSGIDLQTAMSDRAWRDDLLLRHKAVVFRGFGVPERDLGSTIDLALGRRLAYLHGNSPRTKVGDNVYTSTEYPPEYTISMHNELSYATRWPARLLFYCRTAPGTGGATPVVDGSRWLTSLPPEVRDSFRERGLRYSQHLHDGQGLGRSWQDTFEATERTEVDAILGDGDCDWEWRADGGLQITRYRPATIRHPVSGIEVWFNQADQWHPSALDPDTAAAMAELFGADDELPQSVSYADGGAIPAGYATEIREAGLREAVDVNWHEGDLLLIDNVAVGHGRRPFTGPRKILVAMS
jgi:alpha-ketoglutarate-dependent taurine dioxygenase